LLKIFFSFQAAIEHAFHPTALPALLAQIVLFVSSREMRLCGTSLFPSTPFITFFDFYLNYNMPQLASKSSCLSGKIFT
jgi:hypothetical protein